MTNLKQYPSNIYQSFGIFCWHGYNSNPKLIELKINEENNDINDYQSLGLYKLEQKSGVQIFPIKYNKNYENAQKIKYIKIIIKENYGEEWTYINQIMLYDKEYKQINNALQNSIISFSKNENNHDDFEIEDIDIQKEDEKKEDKNNHQIEKGFFNIKDLENNEKDEEKNNINKKRFDKKDKNSNNSEESNDYNKSYKVSRIEKIIKKNILENESEVDQNTSNNISQNQKTKNNFFELSENKIFKNTFTNTPNRYVFKMKDNLGIINKENGFLNINDKKRPHTPNIIHENQEKNNNKMKQLDSKDYDNIPKTQLKDMENQINLWNEINIYKSKNNNFKKINTNENKANNFMKPEANNFYNKYNNNIIENEMNNNLNKHLIMNKTNYNKYFPNRKNFKINNTINYNDSNQNLFNEELNNNINNKKKNKYSTPPSNRINHNFFENQKYILNDLASNNSLDVNRRLDNLEKNVNEIRKELYSISELISNLSSGNFLVNNFKQNIKLIFDEYMHERNMSNNFNEHNRSFYNELINEESRNTNLESDINKKIEKKINNLSEQIKDDISNKYLKPALNKIELKMKRSLDEINYKIDEINIFNKSNNNIKNKNNKNEIQSNKFFNFPTNSDIFDKSSSKLRNEKYEEINRLGEKLYQKLLEKEKKLKQLKKETSKFLDD